MSLVTGEMWEIFYLWAERISATFFDHLTGIPFLFRGYGRPLEEVRGIMYKTGGIQERALYYACSNARRVSPFLFNETPFSRVRQVVLHGSSYCFFD